MAEVGWRMGEMSSGGKINPLGTRSALAVGSSSLTYYRLAGLADRGVGDLARLPVTVKIILENVLRHCDGTNATEDDVLALARWQPAAAGEPRPFPFWPARVLLQDFTGVPTVVDLAAMRAAAARLGGDPGRVNPLVPVDLVIDHSVVVDRYGSTLAFRYNVDQEYARNRER
jgi:aconitate hydratase